MTDNPTIEEPLLSFLRDIRHRLVIIGSVARGKRWPKDIDFLWDLDRDKAKAEIKAAIVKHGLHFESPFIGSWTFIDYGWMVEIIPVNHGPFYRTVRRRAGNLTIQGIEFKVAQAEDALKDAPK
jgi:hypothetical protein